MVLGHNRDAGAQADIPGLRQQVGDKYVIGGNRLPPRAVMLANPGFAETQFVGQDNAFGIFLEGLGPILFRRVQGHHKFANLHEVPPFLSCSAVSPIG